MRDAKIEETVCEDRISALPEDLLVKILLFVSIKDAVATMVLSKRWRFIWTMLPRLEYKENRDGDDDDDDENKKSIWWFLEKSLELHKAPVLAILLIKLGRGCPSDADVEKSLAKAVDRHVGVLKFKLCWSTVPTRLPKNLYICETLTQLLLSHKILVDSPSSSCLPSLTNLQLFYVVYKDEGSLVRLLSSCPVLEFLEVKRNKDDNVKKFSVKVPSLLYLCYYNKYSDNEVVDTGRSLIIDTPALIDYQITDYSRDSCSIQNMPCLSSAYIDVKSFPDINKFKTFLSTVVSLELFMTDEVLVGCSTINFSRLIKFSLFLQTPHRSDWLEPLLILLKNAPQLEYLLEFTLTKTKDRTLSWNQPSSIPRCLSSQLEIFEYREYGGGEVEKDFLTYILAHSKCLKTVTISMSTDFNLEDEKLTKQELRDIPRVSTTSQLLFK